jgi:hypothetical protein
LWVLGGLVYAVAARAQQPDAEYVTGTVKGSAEGAPRTVDMSSLDSLEFHAGPSQFKIPYAEITSVNGNTAKTRPPW